MTHSGEARGATRVATVVGSALPTVAVVMPAYNEEGLTEFLPEIEQALQPVTAALWFVVVDDASTAEPLHLERLPLGSRVELIRNDTNRGHGPTALRAYAAGRAHDPDLVIHVDGDGQFVGGDFAVLLEAAEGHDGAIGVRASRRDPWFRRALTAGARLITGLGLRGGDANTPLRLYRTSVVDRLLAAVGPDSVVPHLHFTVLHRRLNLDVREIEVTHRARRGHSAVGTSWQGCRGLAVLPSRRLLRLASRAVWELVRRDYTIPDEPQPSRWQWMIAALLGIAAAAAVLPAFGMHLNYDEAYNLQVVTNLLHGHGYASDGALFAGHRQPFDYRITTGPTLMLPVTAAAALLGEHLWVYRLVPTAAYLALLATWWTIGRRLAGPRRASLGGTAAVLGVLALNTAGSVSDSQSGPGTVVGETTATLFLLLAIMLARRPGRAGLCLGLAVMTKVLVLVAVPGVVVAVAICAGRARSLRAFTVLAATAIVPIALWQMVRIVSLGWYGAMEANGDFLRFMHGHGAGMPNPAEQLVRQINMNLGFGAAAVLLAAAVVGGRLASIRRPDLQRGDRALLAGILLSAVALEGYWLMLESQRFVRHSFQAGQLLVPLALVMLVRVVPRLRVRLLRDVVTIVVVSIVVVQAAGAIAADWSPPGPSLAEQRQVADLVARHGSTYRFIEISMVPEVTFFRPDLQPRPLGDAGGLVVFTGVFGRSPTNGCPRVVAQRAGYVLCEVPPVS